ncbi:MAG: addiction module protein [Fimbriiglobus sp.]
MTTEDVTTAALALPVADRWKVLDALMSSLPTPPGEPLGGDLEAVLARRLDDYESGRDPGVVAADFFRHRRDHKAERLG